MSDVCRLPDGRDLGYMRIGNPDGPQIFYLHGLPGSRLEARIWYEKHLPKYGAGMISVERPGMGISTPQPGRTISDHAQDVLHLAEHLGLNEWRIVGVSGGGPYALACARHHPPEKLKGVAVCAGIGPWEFGQQDQSFMVWMNIMTFRFAPWLLHIFYRPLVYLQNLLSDEKQVEMMQNQFKKPSRFLPIQDKDVVVFKDTELLMNFTKSSRESFRQSFSNYIQDARTMGEDWDFRIEDITFRPIDLWYGKKDMNCPAQMGEKTAAALGDQEGVELHIEDETHVSTSVNCAPKILEHLLRNYTSDTTTQQTAS